ncbi:potassium transporter TrkH [Paramagnetospirillum kuznetsovii]|uniref:Trk system potassium uptake protein n=1 Tax=Paramagnetospirillum kuznetsovii TaxID=2053833 RepID=A0A364P2E8_9PROT|nr:TrkH family potassium uptake protein [Paramagnetospirillum kuznetsovii]RAU23528.1 potassium transporter TrkH [Paramagnetospirillum kuznetsovii]
MIDFRPVLFVNGFLLLVLAAAMGIPAVVDLLSDDVDWKVFALSAMTTAFFAMALVFGARPKGRASLTSRQAFMVPVVAWTLTAGFAALPFVFSNLRLGPVDALFEAMSGLTTTGATVIVGLDRAPKGILIWRALLNWLGGEGIIIMAVVILPLLRIGGMQVFRMESSDKSDKIKPRITQVAASITLIYAGFTGLAAVAFWAAGMSRFDAVCHALAAVSTGGFSTSDSNLAHWGTAVQWVAVFAMMVGGSSFTLWTGPWKNWRPKVLDDAQTHWYLMFLGAFAGVLALWQWAVNDMTPGVALRHAAFSVTSVVTTTGFVSTNYGAWGGFAHVVFFVLLFIGGCTGSAAGGVKIFRWELLFALAGIHLKRLLHPHGVFVIHYNQRPIIPQVLDSVLGFVVMYFFTFSVFAVALTMVGVDLITALSGSASALGNVGPGIGGTIGPMGSYRSLPDAAKVILASEMVLGRLELFTVAVLFSRSYWRE